MAKLKVVTGYYVGEAMQKDTQFRKELVGQTFVNLDAVLTALNPGEVVTVRRYDKGFKEVRVEKNGEEWIDPRWSKTCREVAWLKPRKKGQWAQ